MPARKWIVPALLVLVLALCGCARNLYTVTLDNGEKFYADPPVKLSDDKSHYIFSVNGKERVVPFDDVYYITQASQKCYRNEETGEYSCFESFYRY